ncbi:hypothetical protein [Rhodococcus sp. OK302]|uniref:hypothetical protein n=1 Tax=Rhodococcus sp. OK302 TaxID=1882769 RepID=UPI000B9F55A2|nr:hypothetical protein [Rhodococcus sp. OK302]OYD60967.1 hypothetical protein BDB13_5884 [Rhodococcus sp. OK302]
MVAVGVNPKSPNGRYQLHPHFRSDTGVSHQTDCAAGQTEKLMQNGELLTAKSALPPASTYPARLVRAVERERVDSNADRPERSSMSSRPHTTTQSAPSASKGPRRSQVATIRPICAHYVHYRHHLDSRTLELPALYSGQQTVDIPYADAFLQLSTNGLLESGQQPHAIVYGPLLWKAEPDYANLHQLVITLSAGDWDSEQGRLSRAHRLVVDWSMWSESRRNSVTETMRDHYIDAKQAWRDSKNDASGNRAGKLETWIFAFARRLNDTDFLIDTYADYCIVNARLRTMPAVTSPRRSTTKPRRPQRTSAAKTRRRSNPQH